MSQRFFKSGQYEVMIGHEATLNYLFICVYDERGIAVFNNLDRPTPGMTVDEIKAVLYDFKLRAPDKIWSDLQADRRNPKSSSVTVYYDDHSAEHGLPNVAVEEPAPEFVKRVPPKKKERWYFDADHWFNNVCPPRSSVGEQEWLLSAAMVSTCDPLLDDCEDNYDVLKLLKEHGVVDDTVDSDAEMCQIYITTTTERAMMVFCERLAAFLRSRKEGAV